MIQDAERQAIEAIGERLKDGYPGLSVRGRAEGGAVIEGVVQLQRDGVPFESFLVEIHLSEVPAVGQPRVCEIGGRIPKSNIHHVNNDGSLCLGVPEEIWLLLNGQYEVRRFIDEVVAPYLLGVACNLRGEPWPFGERAHGAAGICEFYGERFGTKEPAHVLDVIEVLLGSQFKGHWPCPCGSGAVIRKCHRKELMALRENKFPRDMLERSAHIIGNWIAHGLDGRIDELHLLASRMQRMLERRAAA